MELKSTRYEVRDRVARLTLARPHRRNAWTGRMHHEYRWAMTTAEQDDDVRVIVVTGAADDEGHRSFCVGADSQALEGHADRGAYDSGLRDEDPPMPAVDQPFLADFAFQLGMRTPVIASVSGAAAGVGLAVACFADIRFAESGAKLTTAAPTLGLPAEYGLSWLLPRLVGAGRAADWLLSGRVFLAEEAEALGLFSAVLPADRLDPHVDEYAHNLAHRVSARSLAVTKRQLWGDLLHGDPGRSVRESMDLLDELTAGPDFREGAAALVERRPPRF